MLEGQVSMTQSSQGDFLIASRVGILRAEGGFIRCAPPKNPVGAWPTCLPCPHQPSTERFFPGH